MSLFLNMKIQKGYGRFIGMDYVEVRFFLILEVSDLFFFGVRKEFRVFVSGVFRVQIEIWCLGIVYGCRFRIDVFFLKKFIVE